MGLHVDPKAKALIFDLDGTLSDSLPVHLATWKKIGNSIGFVFEEQLVFEMTGMPTIAFARRIIEENGLHLSPEELVRMKQEAFWEAVHLVKPVDQVVSIVKAWHGRLPMSVGTGASRKSATLQLGELGLTPYFDYIITADDVTRHKPYPETFLQCACKMGVRPEECQVFEDGILGMEAGHAAGMIVTDVRPFINYGAWALSQS
ncbi:MAG: HAD-IA family hydrolase [Prolixibacteraceae bacterium]|jgi:beta-phosphoglucomutase family hydrolase|nr:HAD-IA family hydrolase [Prolixibacteraceae bacterium]MDI9564156.1 HAD-IA family hydrolase [Bacteroidota bacterium]OQB79573.1 MAG: Fructose-1-phosphate phosphatase YqaB [Bacteroidetes bacterium ADurb.Bin123]HOF54523.1 HAD-IA family hydrolase [Prolixibacteraceae bacterium]HOR99328.1 HAD-IA family hydrolase [Prolixibacteraceae bacterium]